MLSGRYLGFKIAQSSA